MIKTTAWTVIFSLAAGILQSTILPHIALYRAVPDLALGIVVYSAYVNGTMTGQVSGFFSGLFLDFLSSAPLGMNCLIRTLIGALAGAIKGTFFLDMVFLPVILCALATVAKAVILFVLHLVLAAAVPAYSLAAPVFWAELALNCLCAPLLFGLLRRFKPLAAPRENS
jgi:rod shape-determining protein MreD